MRLRGVRRAEQTAGAWFLLAWLNEPRMNRIFAAQSILRRGTHEEICYGTVHKRH